jgi:hypothetical protein
MAGLKKFTVDEFLSYETRGRSEFLGAEWKKAGFINVWLHRSMPFAGVWQHQIPRIDIRDDPETGRPSRKIFSGNYRCIEDEAVLTDQYRRDKETFLRRSPPEVCPICKMIEYAHQKVLHREWHWLQPMFDFDVGNQETRVLLRASGMWNGYKPDKLDDTQKAEMEEAGISPRFGWKENLQAGLKYIFCIVDDANVGKGVQIMKEGQALGDKLKLAIAKEMKRNPRNPALGDPVQNPYAFGFEYREKETPDKKYDCFRVELDLTQAIDDLISKTPAPDLEMLEGNYQPDTLRATLERVACVDLPWDDFFTPEAAALLASDAPPPEEAKAPAEAPQRSRVQVPARAPVPAPARAPAPAQAPQRAAPPPAAVEMFACDNEACQKPIKATDAVCPYCGHKYEVEAPAPQPLIPLRKRSEAAAAKRAAPAPGAPGVRNGVPTMRGQVVAPSAQHRAPAPAPRPQAAQRAPQAAPAPRGREVAEQAAATNDDTPPPDDLGFGDFGEDQLSF